MLYTSFCIIVLMWLRRRRYLATCARPRLSRFYAHLVSSHLPAQQMSYIDNPTKLFSHFPASLPPSAPPHKSPLTSYWLHNFVSPLTKRNSEGAVPETADVVIIGSGITGTCAATRLVDQVLASAEVLGDQSATSTQQLAVLMLEARDFSSGATGVLQSDWCCLGCCRELYKLLARISGRSLTNLNLQVEMAGMSPRYRFCSLALLLRSTVLRKQSAQSSWKTEQSTSSCRPARRRDGRRRWT